MRDFVVVSAADKKHYVSKVLVARSILYLNRGLMAKLFSQTFILDRTDQRSLEAIREAWIEWLDQTPKSAFLSYIDAYHHFVAEISVGDWWIGKMNVKPASKTALNALKARINVDRRVNDPSGSN